MLALAKSEMRLLLSIENSEAAAGNKWRDITAAETDVRIRSKHGIGKRTRRVIIRANGSGRNIIGANWIVRGEWRRNDLVNSDAGSCEAFVQTFDKPGVTTVVRSLEESSLLDGSAKISEADDLESVAHAAAEFLFDIGAASGERACDYDGSKEG
jgi:hypothetical protein